MRMEYEVVKEFLLRIGASIWGDRPLIGLLLAGLFLYLLLGFSGLLGQKILSNLESVFLRRGGR